MGFFAWTHLLCSNSQVTLFWFLLPCFCFFNVLLQRRMLGFLVNKSWETNSKTQTWVCHQEKIKKWRQLYQSETQTQFHSHLWWKLFLFHCKLFSFQNEWTRDSWNCYALNCMTPWHLGKMHLGNSEPVISILHFFSLRWKDHLMHMLINFT